MSLNIGPVISNEKVQKTPNQSDQLNWKKALSDTLTAEIDEVLSLRAWSVLTQKLKNLCPETDWLFIREEDKTTNDKELINLTWEWMNKLVANPQWPFPEKISFSIESKRSERFIRIAVENSNGVIPFVSPPAPLCVAPWKKDQKHGWKIFAINPSQLKKSGQA